MNSSGFSAPNTWTLSDKVIGKVVPKTEIRRHVQRSGTQNKTKRGGRTGAHSHPQVAEQRPKIQPDNALREESGHSIVAASPKHHASTTETVVSASPTIKRFSSHSSTSRKRPSSFLSDLQTAKQIIASIQASSFPVTEELTRAMVVDALERKIRHREYSRACQARHREKEKMYEADLQGYITKLQCEIKALELKVQDISRSPNITNIWAIAAEYATYFNDYVSSPDTLHATASSFLHGIMAPDVAIGSEFGVEAQLETWKLFALYFADVHLELKGMDMSTTHTLAVRTIISVTITRNTLCRAFPHLSHDGPGGTKGSKWSPLANRLLGQKLVMRGSALFGWNNAIHP